LQHFGLKGREPRYQFVPQRGYVSLFPLALQLVPWDAEEVAPILRWMSNPEELWTDFGLRSLAKSASMYNRYNSEHDPPYWRGSIWVNINFLVLRSLKECIRCDSHCTIHTLFNILPDPQV
jgi:mannosyl-oligosaccharide glucosidase